jgi:uncharacterized protein
VLTRKNARNGDELSILGFGCMRLPLKGSGVDEPRAVALIRDAVDKGINYFDTAYVYHNGKSESILGLALADGYRDRVRIATKIPPFMVRTLGSAHRILATQLSRLRTDRIDYYLIHLLIDMPLFERLEGLGFMRWLEELKAAGTIGNIGFSFHGVGRDFELVLKAYPWDFCQIQYNYMDEQFQAGTEGLRREARLGIPAIVMEPLRGGSLTKKLPSEAVTAFRDAGGWSPAEWALRWVWNHPEVNLALSGMSDEAQLAENLRIAEEARADSLTAEELAVLETVKRVILEKTKVPCTSCGYCMPCPSGVDIPGCFSCLNEKYLFPKSGSRMHYFLHQGMTSKPAIASRCTECGICESHCPQNIAIRGELKKVSAEMEGFLFKPTLAIARKIMNVR